MPGNTHNISEFERKFYNDFLRQFQAGHAALEVSLAEIALRLNGCMPLAFDSSKKRERGIHPSELGGCKRRIYYGLIGADESSPRLAEPKLIAGTTIHHMFQERFQSTDLYEVKSEIPIEGTEFARRLHLIGYCDLGFYIKNVPILGVEVKSGLLYNAVPFRHQIQATAYQQCLGFPFMWYFYMDRDWAQYRSFLLSEPDPEITESIKTICQKVIAHAAALSPPDREEDFMQCKKICRYAKVCGSIYGGGKYVGN